MKHIIETEYQGSLRTKNIHLRSGNEFITDAPVDNNGKGEAFSPTDTVCAALSSCMMTIMGIEANKMGVDLDGLKANVTKVMAASPRKISKIKVEFTSKNLSASKEQLEKLKEAALKCPVALSLDPSIDQGVSFDF